MKFIEELVKSVDEYSDGIRDIDQPVQDDEELVGTLSPRLKKFWSLIETLATQHNFRIAQHLLEHNTNPELDKELCAKLHLEIETQGRKLKALDNLFWNCVMTEMDLWSTPAFGLRAGYKVVKVPLRTTPEEEQGGEVAVCIDDLPELEEFLEQALSGDDPDSDSGS